MSEAEARRAVIIHLMVKSEMALAAARRECDAGDLPLAMNRVYYACFYAASAVPLRNKKQFARHAGVRPALHQYLINPGRVSPEFGKFHDQAFEDRQEADYTMAAEFEATTVAAGIEEAERFGAEMRRLLHNG